MRAEELKVYQAAEALVGEVDAILRRLPIRIHRTADHLDRSANSVLNNTAEGAAIFSPKGKANAYAIARKEAQEVKAALRATVLRKGMTQREIAKAYNLADCIIAMLTKMIKNLETRI
jgi:four helix bundle protein